VLLNILLIGAVGGALSGMLGVGGAVILLPLLTTFAGLTLKEASNITVVQVVASSLIGWWSYRRGGLVHTRLAVVMGLAGAIGGFAGGYGTGRFTDGQLEVIFLGVVLMAIALLFIPIKDVAALGDDMPHFNVLLALGIGGIVGILAGLLGAGGGFLIVPLMLVGLRMPVHLAIGSSSIVKLITSSFAYAGKLLGTHIDPFLAATLLVSSVPFTYLGTYIAKRSSARVLRIVLSTILILIAVRSIFILLTTSL
jgi:uncharacterized protein